MDDLETAIVPYETNGLLEERDELLSEAKQLAAVQDQRGFERAAIFVRVRCKGVLEEIDKFCKDNIEGARQALRAALQMRDQMKGALPEAMLLVERGMADYLLLERDRRQRLEQELGVNLPKPQSAPGVSSRQKVSGEVDNKAEFLHWLLQQDEEWLRVVAFKQAELNRLAKKFHSSSQTIPGFRIVRDLSIVKHRGQQ